MRFRTGSSLDPSQISDRRGMRAGPMAAGGVGGLGLIGLLIVLGIQLLGGSKWARVPHQPGAVREPERAGLRRHRRVPHRRRRQRPGGLPHRRGHQQRPELLERRVRPPQRSLPTVTDPVLHQPGVHRLRPSDLDVGPFYCPADKFVYLDLSFFDELRTASTPPADPSRGVHRRPRVRPSRAGPARHDEQGPRRPSATAARSVRLEPPGRLLRRPVDQPRHLDRVHQDLTEADIVDGLDAASVGDDQIQRTSRGGSNPEAWTHGSAAERQRWFSAGYKSGQLEACDTFAVAEV